MGKNSLLFLSCFLVLTNACKTKVDRPWMICPRESSIATDFSSPSTEQLRSDPVKSRFVAAHRGETSQAHGNTRSAFVSGVRNFIPFLEVDIRMTKESELFLFHDRRLTSKEVIVPDALLHRDANELSSHELSQIRYADQGNEPLLRFTELLELLKENAFTSLLLDMKSSRSQQEALLRRVLEEVKRRGLLNRVVVQCQGIEELRFVTGKFPEFLRLARLEKLDELEEAISLKPLILQGDREWFPVSALSKAHSLGIAVLQKTLTPDFDNENGWRLTLQEGANLVLTDKALALQTWGCSHPQL